MTRKRIGLSRFASLALPLGALVAAGALVSDVFAPPTLSAAFGEDAAAKPAATFPALTSIQSRAGKDPITALRGRVVLLVLLDTRYPRCTEAVADLNKLHDTLGPKGLTLLAVTTEEKADIDAWILQNKVKFGFVLVDPQVDEQILKRSYPAPGYPWSYLIDAEGNVKWSDQPQRMDPKMVDPLFAKVTKPPELPPSFAAQQKLLDDGTWSLALTSLKAGVDGGKLDKIDLGWAKGTAQYIERRRPQILAEAAELETKLFAWDAWEVYTDYQRRFEGMADCDVAKAKAEAIRKDPAAQEDLKNGDDVAKAGDFLKAGKTPAAKLILERISKLKNSRFSDRAKTILASMNAKK